MRSSSEPSTLNAMATGSELAIIKGASAALSTVTRASTTIVDTIRRGAIVHKADRDMLRDQLVYLRRQEVATYIGNLGIHNLSILFDLYDQVDRYADDPKRYCESLRIVGQTSRLLSENLDRLQRELR